ncbi:MAG: Fur family transcriptional regulator [Cyanobacteria bacterium P01_A01_bin.137]
MATRLTRNQERILQALQGLEQAISAQDLHSDLRQTGSRIGLATVYRALEALKLDGTVQVRTLSNGESLYSLTHEDRHHLTCLRCGDSLPIEECPVHDLETHLNDSHHFRIFYHTLEFFGLCAKCQIVSG